MSRICILGGGFGGLYTALHLSRLPWRNPPEIVLIDRNDRFLFTPLLYERITGELESWEIAPRFSDLLEGTGIEFKLGTVTQLDISQQQVQILSDSTITQLPFDYVLLSVGVTTPIEGTTGVADHALTFRSLADADRLEARLHSLEQSNPEKIRILIAGGGTSGVELACKLADRLGERGRIRIVDRNSTLLSRSPEINRQAALKALESRSVWVDLHTSVVEVSAHEVTLDFPGGRESLPVDIVLWTVGNVLPTWIQRLPLAQDPRSHQVMVTPTLHVIDHPEIFAIGDLAACQDALGIEVPTTAQTAFQQSQYCAWNIWASIVGKPLVPFVYIPLGEMVSLGTTSAVAALFDRVPITGFPGYLTRRLIYWMRLPTIGHQMEVGKHWLRRSLKLPK